MILPPVDLLDLEPELSQYETRALLMALANPKLDDSSDEELEAADES